MNHALLTDLLRRSAQDQAAREAEESHIDGVARAEYILQMDSANSVWIKAMVEYAGWPSVAEIGEEGENALWLLVQHSPDLDLQKACLAYFQAATVRSKSTAIYEAYLIDRIAVREGRPQCFGTQGHYANGTIVPWPIEDEAHVDDRRARLNMGLLAAYFAAMNQTNR